MSATPAESSSASDDAKRVLGIEGGGTKTEWILQVWKGGAEPETVREGSLPSANLKLISDQQLLEIFSVLPKDVTHVGAYLAGCATIADHERLTRLARQVWPEARLAVGSDRDSAMATAFDNGDGIIVISGTGAAVHGRRGGQVEKAGGWGQLLGDRGGGYHLAMQGLRSLLSHYDLNDRIPPLAHEVLRTLGLNQLRDLVDWASQAEKMSVARLAPAIFGAARRGDREMRKIIRDGAEILAEFTHAVATRLQFEEPPVTLFGGLFAHHPEYVTLYTDRLAGLVPGAKVTVCRESGAIGAAWLAAQTAEETPEAAPTAAKTPGRNGRGQENAAPSGARDVNYAELASATTEQRNPRSENLDKLSAAELVDLFVSEEDYVRQALAACREPLAAAVEIVSGALAKGGRLFYAGAGTSGRLGVLDASEIPPTFGASPELVQGIIAGGAIALHRAVEGAEDQPESGALAVAERGVRAGDVVCGLAASGRTPFVLGALARGRELGARTILLTCNPARQRSAQPWDVEIDLPTGPELVTGSTRLKAGTATKVALNILSTSAMIRLGKVRGNLMIDVQVSNAKLRDRGIRLVCGSLGIPYEEARVRLEEAGWNVRRCIEQHAPAAR